MAAACPGVDSQDLATILDPFRTIFVDWGQTAYRLVLTLGSPTNCWLENCVVWEKECQVNTLGKDLQTAAATAAAAAAARRAKAFIRPDSTAV